MVEIILVPHPDLSPSQRKMVMRDYEMKNGRARLSCRKAMLFYTLRHLNLESPETSKKPAQQHVIVHNRRSEEHTSELQSLMRISYAVFCLKKKNTNYTPK